MHEDKYWGESPNNEANSFEFSRSTYALVKLHSPIIKKLQRHCVSLHHYCQNFPLRKV